MGSREGLSLRQQALEALEKSTKMLEVAIVLMRQGNQAEAERVRTEARTQRTISALLMAEANNIEQDARLAQHGQYRGTNIPKQSQDTTRASH